MKKIIICMMVVILTLTACGATERPVAGLEESAQLLANFEFDESVGHASVTLLYDQREEAIAGLNTDRDGNKFLEWDDQQWSGWILSNAQLATRPHRSAVKEIWIYLLVDDDDVATGEYRALGLKLSLSRDGEFRVKSVQYGMWPGPIADEELKPPVRFDQCNITGVKAARKIIPEIVKAP